MTLPIATRPPAWRVALSAACLGVLGCGVPEATGPAHGRRVTVVERYGAQGSEARRVAISATLVPTDGGAYELDDVFIEPTPGDSSLVRKIEALLEDVALRTDADAGWPSPARTVPEDARPELARLQLGMALLATHQRPPGASTSTRAHWTLDDQRVVAGVSRITGDDGAITLEVVTLIHAHDRTGLAIAHLSGAAQDGVIRLEGTRRLTGQTPQAVAIEVRQEHVSPPDVTANLALDGTP